MDEIKSLISQALRKGARAQKAIARLVDMGIPAVPAIVDAIRAREKDPTWNLRKILLQIRDPDIVPIFIELIEDQNSNLVLTAFEALGRFKDARAFDPLTNCLLDPTKRETRRSQAAEALGELGDQRAIEKLLSVAREIVQQPDVAPAIKEYPISEGVEIDESSLRLVLSIAIALAKLGNHEMAAVVTALVRYQSNDVYSDDEVIRTQAAEALHYVVGPGALSALRDALRDDYSEVRVKSIDAVFYLGVKEGINELMQCVDDENSSVSNNAIVRLGDLTGESFDHNIGAGELQQWWRLYEGTYSTGICYRSGKPIWLPDVIALLETPRWRDQVVRELRILTGEDFGYNPYAPAEDQDDLLKRTQVWWETEGHRFEAGCLYKYGRKQDIQSIF